MQKLLSLLVLSTAIFFSVSESVAQEKKSYKMACIAFYNLENLYDTINYPGKDDEEFTPTGNNRWTGDRYKKKLERLSEVISQIGNEFVKGGPVIMGFSEVENKQVVEDLINTPKLKPMNYGIVHYDSPDRRGVDVALIYQKKYFQVINSRAVPLHMANDTSFRSRDQLVVTGIFDGEPLSLIVNHWPSRRGGETISAPKRAAAATLCKSQADSLTMLNPNAKIIIMGDLNDDPKDESVVKFLKAKNDAKDVKKGELYNPMYKLHMKDGIGSLAYNDQWNLFDQMIVSYPLLGEDKSTYKFYAAHIFNKPFLTQKDGAFKGYPLRTYAGGSYVGGYSDHFPAYLFIIKEKKN